MKQPLIIYWVRRDFRLSDNAALTLAGNLSIVQDVPLLPVFIVEDYMVQDDPLYQFGYPSRWFLMRALPRFAAKFEQFLMLRGKAVQQLLSLSRMYDVTIFVNEDVYPDFYTQVQKIREAGITVEVCGDALTVDRDTRTGQGNIYSVFTPFKNAVWREFVSKKPLPIVSTKAIQILPDSEFMQLKGVELEDELKNLFKTSRTLKVGEHVIDLVPLVGHGAFDEWYFDEEGAFQTFTQFVKHGLLHSYKEGRDSLHADAESLTGRTSKMSLALAWGLVSPRMLTQVIRDAGEEIDDPTLFSAQESVISYISELIWREFYRYLFFHNPGLMHMEFQEKFRGTIAWEEDTIAYDRFISWIRGETGYPIVDAAMKQIKEWGWMHNRARMIVASVLTKNLGVDWRWGQEYFRSALIDLDEASNNGGWQWGASVGADPKPIRIFNPELQAKNYDAESRYQKRWLYNGEEPILKQEVVPIIEHKIARNEALKRYGLNGVTPRDY